MTSTPTGPDPLARDALAPDRLDAPPSPALSAPPGPNPRFPLFDGLRGVAVLLVLGLHAALLSGRVGFGVGGRFADAAGGLGVIVFFVISGFLLYRPYAAARLAGRRGPSPRGFARRRALRILPAYWIVLTILALFPGVTGAFSGHWWHYYGYLQTYFARSTSSGIPVAWTLCVEVTFYLLLPLYAAAMGRIPAGGRRRFLASEGAAATGLGALGLLFGILAARHDVPSALGSSLLPNLLWFALGMGLAAGSAADAWDLGLGRPGQARRDVSLALTLPALGAVVGLMAMVPAGGLFGEILQADRPQSVRYTALKLVLELVVVTCLVLPAAFGEPRRGLVRAILGSRPLVWLGVVSYSFYLWHLTIVEFIAVHATDAFSAHGLDLMAHVHTARMTVLFVIALLVTAPIAWLSYRVFELPFLRLKARAYPQRA